MKSKFNKKTIPPRAAFAVKHNGTECEGRVVAHFGAVVEVEDDKGQVIRCHLRKNQEPVIIGDRVLWRFENETTGTVVCGLPRKSLLLRPDTHGKNKLIAANLDTLVIVVAPPPNFSDYLLDCYLVTAEWTGIPPMILLNKRDLLDEAMFAQMTSRLDYYATLGYPVIYSSLFLEEGLGELSASLAGKIGVLVGASGVGKSSLIAKLTGANGIKVGDVSAAQQGKHTTTATRFYHFSGDGGLIDSPGVREFSLACLAPADILKGFIEFQPFVGACQFRNCQHGSEPGCALQQAVKENKMASWRWKNYLAMRNVNR